jgi:hypothetical protein
LRRGDSSSSSSAKDSVILLVTFTVVVYVVLVRVSFDREWVRLSEARRPLLLMLSELARSGRATLGGGTSRWFGVALCLCVVSVE